MAIRAHEAYLRGLLGQDEGYKAMVASLWMDKHIRCSYQTMRTWNVKEREAPGESHAIAVYKGLAASSLASTSVDASIGAPPLSRPARRPVSRHAAAECSCRCGRRHHRGQTGLHDHIPESAAAMRTALEHACAQRRAKWGASEDTYRLGRRCHICPCCYFCC